MAQFSEDCKRLNSFNWFKQIITKPNNNTRSVCEGVREVWTNPCTHLLCSYSRHCHLVGKADVAWQTIYNAVLLNGATGKLLRTHSTSHHQSRSDVVPVGGDGESRLTLAHIDHHSSSSQRHDGSSEVGWWHRLKPGHGSIRWANWEQGCSSVADGHQLLLMGGGRRDPVTSNDRTHALSACRDQRDVAVTRQSHNVVGHLSEGRHNPRHGHTATAASVSNVRRCWNRRDANIDVPRHRHSVRRRCSNVGMSRQPRDISREQMCQLLVILCCSHVQHRSRLNGFTGTAARTQTIPSLTKQSLHTLPHKEYLYLIIGQFDREFVTLVNLFGQGRGLRWTDRRAAGMGSQATTTLSAMDCVTKTSTRCWCCHIIHYQTSNHLATDQTCPCGRVVKALGRYVQKSRMWLSGCGSNLSPGRITHQKNYF